MGAHETPSDPRWALLQSARSDLVRALAEDGVVGVEYVAAFPQDEFAVWLVTITDEERDRLGTLNPRLEDVRAVLLRSGFTEAWLGSLMTTAQSQETVSRDYEGKWFYARGRRRCVSVRP